MEVHAPFEPEPRVVRAVRGFVRVELRRAGYARRIVSKAVAGASELAANAVLHARTPFEVGVLELGDRLRIEVVDSNVRLPSLSEFSPEVTSGRGLHVLAALADDWGAEPLDGGKVVWFELRIGPSDHPSDSPRREAAHR